MRCFTRSVLLSAALVLLLNAAERFDYLFRCDFFAGMAGDRAFDRAVELCEENAGEDPRHAKAMGLAREQPDFLSGQYSEQLTQQSSVWTLRTFTPTG